LAAKGMAFMRPTLRLDATPVLRRGAVMLRAPHMGDFEHWAALRAASRAELSPFEPLWAEDELSRGSFRERLRRYQREAREDQGYAFFIFGDAGRTLLGGISVGNVRRGITQAASVGYWIGSSHTRQGHASTALAAVVDFALIELRLHRVEAACMPINAPSIRVLEKAGFGREGLARRSLRINGAWEDHLVFAIIAEDVHV
jgi:[ribosomal protein S5]-alanine N-acetyltransferase